MEQLERGFKTAGAWLLGMVWLAVVFAGLAVAFSSSRFPRPIGWCLLAIAACVLLATADRWINAVPGIFGVATLNSLVMTLTGHSTGNPSVLVPRPLALVASVLLAASALMSLRFQDRKLFVHDRITFLIYAVCLAYAGIRPLASYWALGTATAALFAAWSYNRLTPTESAG
jgi:hypothetical protein